MEHQASHLQSVQKISTNGNKTTDAFSQDSTVQRLEDQPFNDSVRQVAQERAVERLHDNSRQAAQRQRLDSLQRVSPEAGAKKTTSSSGLPDQLKGGIESLSGISMDHVRVHYDSAKPAQLNALAYAQGNDIYLGSGQDKHLPHEAWHVVQQARGKVKPTARVQGNVPVNADAGLEAEADIMGNKALAEGGRVIPPAEQHSRNLQILPDTVQLKIDSLDIQGNIRDHFKGSKVDPIAMEAFFQDAFENTSSYEEAVTRIKSDLRHHEAIFGVVRPVPKGGGSSVRSKINIDAGRKRPKHDFSTPSVKWSEGDVLDKWKDLNTEKFYAATRKSLKIARDPEHGSHAAEKDKLDELVAAYAGSGKVKSLIDKYVRVKAVKARGASSGTGLDELFKTSETMKYLQLSYRPPEGISAVSEFKGEEFDWMDAQQQIRLSTELIIWANDLVGEISGHTGTFQKEFASKWMTSGQALMHEVRDDAISSRSNPATAVVEAIATHLRITENVSGFTKAIYQSVPAEKALTSAGHSLAKVFENVLDQLGRHRDRLKVFLEHFRSHVKPPRDSSPLRARFGSDDYYPESPMQYPDDELEVNEKVGKVAGNPLPNLAGQWRMNHKFPPEKIPKAPVNPVLASARESMKKILGASTATKIHNAAKRMAKPLTQTEDADADEIDRVMITVYLNKARDYEKTAGMESVIAALEEALK